MGNYGIASASDKNLIINHNMLFTQFKSISKPDWCELYWKHVWFLCFIYVYFHECKGVERTLVVWLPNESHSWCENFWQLAMSNEAFLPSSIFALFLHRRQTANIPKMAQLI